MCEVKTLPCSLYSGFQTPKALQNKLRSVFRLNASSSRSWVSTCICRSLASPLLAAVSKPVWDRSCQDTPKGTTVKYLPTSEGNLKSLEHLRQGDPLMWRDCDSYMWFEHPGTRNCPLAPMESHWSLRGLLLSYFMLSEVLIPLFPHVPRSACFPVLWCTLVKINIQTFHCKSFSNCRKISDHFPCSSLWLSFTSVKRRRRNTEIIVRERMTTSLERAPTWFNQSSNIWHFPHLFWCLLGWRIRPDKKSKIVKTVYFNNVCTFAILFSVPVMTLISC